MPGVTGPTRRTWPRFWDAYRAGRWEPDTRAFLQERLKSGDLFLDVGAWIGPVTLWALELGAEVVAVEPDPVAHHEFERVCPNVELWKGAMTVHGGDAHIAPRFEWGDSMCCIVPDGVRVDSWTIDEILYGREPALVKMDVEGYELKLLPTVAPYLAERGVPLHVSLHDGLPDLAWFDGYREVRMPEAARDRRGRSLTMTALP